MARTKRVSKARKGRRVRSKRVRSKRMGKKRTKRSSNKRMRRSFIKKSRGRPKRSLRRMRGGSNFTANINITMLETVPKLTTRPEGAGSKPVGLGYVPDGDTDTDAKFAEVKQIFKDAYDEARRSNPEATESDLYEMAKSDKNYVKARRAYVYPKSSKWG